MLFAGQEIPKSPFEVNVDKALGDASKVTVKGPGVEPVGNIANKPTYFDIYTAGKSSRTQEEKSLIKMFLHTEVVFLWRSTLILKKIVTVGAGTGDVTAMIKDPQGQQNTVEVMMEDKGDSVYRCTYRPTQAGPHTITVTFGGVGIPKSPFSVDVGPGEYILVFPHLSIAQLTSFK